MQQSYTMKRLLALSAFGESVLELAKTHGLDKPDKPRKKRKGKAAKAEDDAPETTVTEPRLETPRKKKGKKKKKHREQSED